MTQLIENNGPYRRLAYDCPPLPVPLGGGPSAEVSGPQRDRGAARSKHECGFSQHHPTAGHGGLYPERTDGSDVPLTAGRGKSQETEKALTSETSSKHEISGGTAARNLTQATIVDFCWPNFFPAARQATKATA